MTAVQGNQIGGNLVWKLGEPGESCSEVCAANQMTCDNDSRLALDTFDKVENIMVNVFGKQCGDWHTNGHPYGPRATEGFQGIYECDHNDGGALASCAQKSHATNIHMICACHREATVDDAWGECCSGKLNDDNVQLDGCCFDQNADQSTYLTPEEIVKQVNFIGSYGDCVQWGMDLFGKGVAYVSYVRLPTVSNCILWPITDCGKEPPATVCPDPAVAAQGGNDVCLAEGDDHVIKAGPDGQVAELGQCYFGMVDSCSCRNKCQEDQWHLSFEWKEGEAPNCCCYVTN